MSAIYGMEDGRYCVEAFSEAGVAEGRVVAIANGQSVEDVELVVQPRRTIRMSIAGVMPAEGSALVTVWNRERGRTLNEWRFRNGEHFMQGIPQGAVAVRARARVRYGEPTRQITHEVVVDDGAPPRLRFDFSGRSRLSGVVTSEGRPLVGVDLVIAPADQSLPTASLRTTRDGRYDAQGISEGLHLVLTRLGHHYEVQVAGDTSFDIRLPPTSLSGVIRSERTGLPVAGTVQLRREEQLDLAARLRLFQKVCGAVQHAHQRGVIHRDLKAANLLVDGDGHVKVIDFGVARLIERDSGSPESGGETMAGEIIGTLDAMSPEQVSGRREDVDARSDVYALGAVLYQLATGQRPFDLGGVPLPEAVRRICDDEPSPPSRIDPGLPREIDWIVATAMAKEPERRYATALELERDVGRLLARQPVLAGPPTRTYRIRKFCERHRAGVVATSIGAVAVVVGLIGAAFGLMSSAEARNAEAAASAEAAVVERFASFLAALFSDSAPEQADGELRTPRELLDRGARWIDEKLGDRPQVQARLLRTVGQVYSGLGHYDDASDTLASAVEIARGTVDSGERRDAAEIELARGLTALGQLHRRLDDVAAAETAYREALAIQERVLGPDHIDLGHLLNELGLLAKHADPDAALRYYRRSLDLLIRHRGEDCGDAGVLLANIGGLLARLRRYDEATQNFERALPIVIEHHGENDPRAAGILGSLANAHLNLGNYELAERLQLRDIELSERALEPNHPNVGLARMNLARIAERLDDVDRALEQFELATRIFDGHFSADHMLPVMIRVNHSRTLIRAGRRDSARAALESVMARSPDSVTGKRARLAGAVVLTELERLEGHHDRALELAESALADPMIAGDAKLTADAHWARAYVLLGLDRRAEADRARGSALELPAVGPTAAAAPQALSDAKFFAIAGDHARALDILTRAVEAGFRSVVMLTDPALAELRRDDGFARITDLLDRRAAK